AHRNWERSHEEIKMVHAKILAAIAEKGPLCSADLDLSQKVDWYWSRTKLSRAALEHMYFSGELAIHHKNGTMKYYDFIENCVPADILAEPEPYPSDFEHRKWRVLKRIGSLGLLWNRASDAWLGISGLKSKERDDIFAALLSEEQILPIRVEGINHILYCLAEDIGFLEKVKETPTQKRCEFIAPLDNMLWDRKLIQALFGFEYKWEIYTPQAERKYGYYVLPILYGERFVGRIEMVYDKKNKELQVSHLWYEPDVKPTKALKNKIDAALKHFARFHRGR
ncbi:MAG: winged helix DNA-binding domain-containing protein, partial [Lachnospiraceae bacterium]|nr:winged helix DNA-binding domain-containing protein [Lachnospiraceae bacterium]